MKPDIRYSPFKKNTWGHYKVKVFDEEEEVVYKLKVEVPVIDVPNTSQRPFNGEIQTKTYNLKILFCGLFLLEQVFEIRDNQMIWAKDAQHELITDYSSLIISMQKERHNSHEYQHRSANLLLVVFNKLRR